MALGVMFSCVVIRCHVVFVVMVFVESIWLSRAVLLMVHEIYSLLLPFDEGNNFSKISLFG